MKKYLCLAVAAALAALGLVPVRARPVCRRPPLSPGELGGLTGPGWCAIHYSVVSGDE
jgi:hypothetical protein